MRLVERLARLEASAPVLDAADQAAAFARAAAPLEAAATAKARLASNTFTVAPGGTWLPYRGQEQAHALV